mgnify:CR=1 FL=1
MVPRRLFVITQFQYHTGPIKSGGLFPMLLLALMAYFNTTLVQLKVFDIFWVTNVPIDNFNTTLVQLKDRPLSTRKRYPWISIPHWSN